MKKLGVIIARFQTSELHVGHIYLIDHVISKSDKVLILLGCSPVKHTFKNPLDYNIRCKMIKSIYTDDNVICLPLNDTKYNSVWSENIDKILHKYKNDYDITLYGSRDSFIDSYFGIYNIEEIEPLSNFNGTSCRENIINCEPKNTVDFREGIIFSTKMRYPTTYPTVDIAIYHRSKNQILLGRKSTDLEFEYRFIGGFVDPTDSNLESAAKREVHEETGDIEVDNFKYISSRLVSDWRYKNEQDSIMTSFFICDYIFGHAKASDDIAEVKWFDLDQITDEILVLEHRFLLPELLNYISKNNEKY